MPEKLDGTTFEVNGAQVTGNRVMDLMLLQEFITEVAVCKDCRNGSLHLEPIPEKRCGLATMISAVCDFFRKCRMLQTSTLTGGRHEVSLRFSCTLSSAGKGRESGAFLCDLMNLPPSTTTKLAQHNGKMLEATNRTMEQSMKAAATAEMLAISEDQCVTLDGTWMKRGSSSLYGVASQLC